MRDTIWGVMRGDTMMRDLSTARARIDPGWSSYMELMAAMWDKSGLLGTAEGFEVSALAQAMEHYNDEVRQSVPAERLLVWSPADGWEPLCEFLGAPRPQAPLPHINDATTFADRVIDGAMAALTRWQEQQRAPSAAG
jgi:hypothetical protein